MPARQPTAAVLPGPPRPVKSYSLYKVKQRHGSAAIRAQEWDGGARGNPGPAGAGAVLYEHESSTEVPLPVCPCFKEPAAHTRSSFSARLLAQVGCVCVTLGHATNNVAEYRGLLAGLQAARDLGVRRLIVTGDSMLVVNQARKFPLWRPWLQCAACSSLLTGSMRRGCR